jgi:integrase
MPEKPYLQWLTTEDSESRLNARELEMYRAHRENVLQWMWNRGKNPEAHIGYAETTVKNRSYRLDQIYRWVWEVEGGYTEAITVSHANAYMKYLYQTSYSESYKSSLQKSLHCLFRWQRYELDKDVEWDPVITYSDSSNLSSRDPLTRSERTKLREASLNHQSIPNYDSLTPEQRDEWKAHLAQRHGKPKSEVGAADFAKTDSWKWPSVIWTALDAGLRPIEVEKAKVSWIDLKNGMLRIPPEDAVKNKHQWNVGLRDRTVMILENWLKERTQYERYDDSEHLWLTRYGNPYGSKSLNRRFRKLLDDAGIDRSNRNLSWYSIRHSLGREMVKEMGIGGAAAQLRHKSMRSTLRYVRPSADERKDALDKMG